MVILFANFEQRNPITIKFILCLKVWILGLKIFFFYKAFP